MDRLSNIDAFLQVVFLAIRHQTQELKEEAVKRKEGEHARIKQCVFVLFCFRDITTILVKLFSSSCSTFLYHQPGESQAMWERIMAPTK